MAGRRTVTAALTALGWFLLSSAPALGLEPWPQYPDNPFVINLEHPLASASEGGIFVHDLTNDGRMDYIVSTAEWVAAYSHDGKLLWMERTPIQVSDSSDFPGAHHPGVIAGDMIGDEGQEVAWLCRDGELQIRDAATGRLKLTHRFEGAKALVIANLRREGDRDALLQYSQSELRAIQLESGATLWHTDAWTGIEHSPVRVADVDHDGRDEICGPIMLDHDGTVMDAWDLKRDRGTAMGSFDSLVIADVVPGGPLEVVLAEQGGNNEALLVNPQAVLWGKFHRPPPEGQCAREIDPDKLAVGDFDPTQPGLEVFCRSACGCFPWVFTAEGELLAHWSVKETAPAGWFVGGEDGPADSEGGLEEVVAIDWAGDGAHLLLVKERHVNGKAAIVDPLTGAFMRVFATRAVRVYAADVSGDHREEVIVLEPASADGGNGAIKVFWNADPPPPPRQRRWEEQHYRRQKQNWNYYSP